MTVRSFARGCARFRCNATPPSTLDLYRLTPNNLTDLVNKDTGDVMGDVFFVLNEYDMPFRCANGSGSNARGCFLDVNDGASRPCSPPPTPLSPPLLNSLPVWISRSCFGAFVRVLCTPKNLPATTAVIMRFEVEVDGQFGPYLHCNPPSNGRGGNIPGPFACALGGTRGGGPPPPPRNTSAYCACPRTNRTVGEQRVSMQFGSFGGFIGPLSRKLDGLWFSTTRAGDCGGAAVGTEGCSWRAKAVVKAVNASCVQRNLYSNVESKNVSCFASCPGAAPPPAPANRSTACAVDCFQQTALGLSASELVQPWVDAFGSNDPTKGGCPACMLNDAGAYTCPQTLETLG